MVLAFLEYIRQKVLQTAEAGAFSLAVPTFDETNETIIINHDNILKPPKNKKEEKEMLTVNVGHVFITCMTELCSRRVSTLLYSVTQMTT